MKLFIIFLFLLAGCAPLSPSLSPVEKPLTSGESETIQVIVKPVITSGIQSEDEQKWGVDLSAYFTSFEVRIINRTNEEITFEPARSRLINEVGQIIPELDEKGTIQYYMNGGGDTVMTLVPKSRAIVDEETRRILLARIREGIIMPGGQKEGLLFFKKVSPKHCQEVVLELDVAVSGNGERKGFSFPFSCANKG